MVQTALTLFIEDFSRGLTITSKSGIRKEASIRWKEMRDSEKAPYIEKRKALLEIDTVRPLVSAQAPVTVLHGRWRLGTKLGSGAFGEVYEIDDLKDPRGEMKWVAKVVKESLSSNKKEARKKKSILDSIYYEHLIYTTYLSGCAHVPRLPATQAYGTSDGYRFLIMERLGSDLEKEFIENNKSFPTRTLLQYGRQMVSLLEDVHSVGLLFVDVKPENFMLSEDKKDLFLIDFGLVERYMMFGKHKSDIMSTGTPAFSSISSHKKPRGRKDDLEAVAFVLIYFARGDLPWESDDVKSDAQALQMKEAITIDELLVDARSDCVIPLTAFMRAVRRLSFDERPNYDSLRRLLK